MAEHAYVLAWVRDLKIIAAGIYSESADKISHDLTWSTPLLVLTAEGNDFGQAKANAERDLRWRAKTSPYSCWPAIARMALENWLPGPRPNVFEDVAAFMDISHPEAKAAEPRNALPEDLWALCRKLVEEELQELHNAIDEGNLVEMADGVVDLLYVLIFGAHCFGIPLAAVWEEVQRTNMAKFPGGKPVYDDNNKVVKPEGWQPPDIAAILAESLES